MDSLTDNHLMLGVKAGELDKMALLYKRHSSALYGFAYHQTGEQSGSEDIVQAVFYRMLKYRASFTGQGEFKSWMYHIARNCIHDKYKKSQRYQFLDDMVKVSDAETNHSFVNESEKQDSKNLVNFALGKMDAEAREILVLSKYQDLPYKEIANILEITEANVKVKVHRAIKQLKEIYLKLENGTARF